MASHDEMDVFNTGKHTKVGDIVVIGGDVNLYKVTSTSPLHVQNITKYPSNKNGEMFNLTHFMKNFEEYMKLVKDTDVHDPWGIAVVQQYEDYIVDFKDFMKHNFPPGSYTSFTEFLIFCQNIGHKDMSTNFDELKNTDLYEIIMENEKEVAPQFKKHKLPKKAPKKTSKSPKKTSKSPKKSPKKTSKSPKKTSKTPKKSPKKTSKKTSKLLKHN